jgi:secondary thiamine-phosphate synthase enzyme
MRFTIETKGHYDFINLTEKIKELINCSKVKDGSVLIFVKGTTAAITIMEGEAGALEDFKETLEKIAPEKEDYKHHLKGEDSNGAAHIKSALIKPEVLIPLEKGDLCLGVWQQIILIDFDERPRQREIIVKIMKTY